MYTFHVHRPRKSRREEPLRTSPPSPHVWPDGHAGQFSDKSCGVPMSSSEWNEMIVVDRAYYFAGAHGGRIEQHKRSLHALGFLPYIAPAVKADAFTKQKLEEGITVVSRPQAH
jgi:hypothetical protein